jgi:hypothetical protein
MKENLISNASNFYMHNVYKKIMKDVLIKKLLTIHLILFCVLSSTLSGWSQNIPGGGTGTGANVTVTDNGGTVILNNGIVSITINKTNATITSYIYKGLNLFAGGHGGGSFYWSWNMPAFGGPNGNYTLTSNPASNGGNYAEVHIHSPWSGNTADAAMDVDVYYSLTRGAQGYYVTATLNHPASYPNNPGGEWRCNTYIGSIFDWLSVDPLRNRMMASPADGAAALPVAGAPKEVIQLTSGIYNGQTECKYAYSASLGDLNVWGWTSTSKKVGIWMTVPSHEYYNGGPMKRELTGHNGHTLLNMLNGEHYAMGNKYDMAAGQASQKTFGPFLVYANSYGGSAADPAATVANTLWKDAQSQALAEQSAWPYTWFKNPAYIQESGRGTVTGTLNITDNTNPSASAAGIWIGLAPNDGGIDFQYQASTYQFWVKTDASGNFKIPHVIAGTYNLWAFGPGAAGTFKQTNITVAAGQILNLNTVNWTPTRVGPTVWEIGIPDRDTKEFKNGHSAQVVAGVLPPYAVWGTFQQPTDNLTYTVGQSNWATDWNYVQYTANANVTWKIKFNLTKAPTAGSQAAIYLAFAADFGGTVAATVNGTSVSTGFSPAQQADAMVRLGSQGAFGDTRITFAGSLLKIGANEIDLTMRRSGGDAMYDYVRLEASGVTNTVANIAPSINITSPTTNTTYPNPTSIVLTANATDTDGSIAKVDFYNGTTLIGSAATAPYSITWTGMIAGNYVITAKATDNLGAVTTSAIVNITVLSCTAAISSPSSSICAGSSVILTASTGASYKWFNGTTQVGTAANYTATTAGTYTVEVTNAGGCKATSAVTTITSPALPIATITTPSTSICNGGSALLTASTGASYKWFNGTTQVGTNATYTATTAGAYTVEVTNAGGCKAISAVTTITSSASPTASITTPSTSICTGSSVILTASAGASYKWFNGTTQVGTVATYTATAAGAYTVEVTNTGGCKATSAVTTITSSALPIATITTPSTSICNGSSVILTASTGASYKWFNGTTQVGTNATYIATTAGTYTVEVTNAGGCKATSAATTITSSTLPTATITSSATSICTGSSVILTASTGSSYRWFNGTTQVGTAATYTATTAGAYTVEVTNTGGCKATSAVTIITNYVLPTATISTPSTSICTRSSVILTSSTGSSYRWFNGTTQVGTAATYTATTAGLYTVEVTNAGGCKATSAVTTITVSALPIATITSSAKSICAGSSIILTASTGASYKWFNGTTQVGTAVTYTATTAGPYTVEVTNAGGCKATSAATIITVSDSPIATITAPSTSFCNGNSVILTASAGSSYQWYNSGTIVGTNQIYSASTPGNYVVEVTNASGCKSTSAVTPITVTNSITWYADTDNDGKGDPFNKLDACTQPSGYVSIAGDACPTDPNKIAPGDCGCGKTETSCLDCAGTPNGTAVFDNCKICVGGTTGNTACLSTATINGTTANITVIPQPFDLNTSIQLENQGNIQSITIISASGAIVKTIQEVNTNEITLGEDLASGLYSVIIQSEKGMVVTKIVKK